MSDWLFFSQEIEPVPAALEDWSFSATPVETWTVAQTTGGYGRGPDGLWVLFPANTPRTYFDPITLEDRGVLLEPESYQTVFKPRLGTLSFTNVVRTDLASQPCPFGVGVANLAATAINGFHSFNLISGISVAESIQDGTDVTGQWIIKPNGINRFTMFCQKRDASYASVNFDMREAGSITAPVGCTATIERDVLGYYRMSMSLNSGTGTTTLRFGGQMALDDGARGFLGDGVQGLHLAYWGIERGLVMTSPSAANGTTATIRAADVMTSTVPWIGPGPKSFAIEFTPLTAHDQTVFEAGTADNMQLRIEGGTVRYVATTNGESVAFLSGSTVAPGIPRTVVVTAGFNQFLLGHSGTILGADVSGSPPSNLTTMRIGGALTGVGFQPLAVKRLKFWNEALSQNATIQYSENITIPGVAVSETVVTVQPAITVPNDQNTVTFLVSLSQQDLVAKVNYRTVSDTAIAGVDFLDTSGTLEFISGELTKTITVQLGARAQADRAFKFELNFPKNVTIGNSICWITLLRKDTTLPATPVDILFGQVLGTDWSHTRLSPAPRRRQDGIWDLVAPNSPAQHWVFANYPSGMLLDTAGHDQCLFDSVLPKSFSGLTPIIDLVTQTMVGTRSVILEETATMGEHRFVHPITAGVAANGSEPAIPATAEVPTGDFTVWMIVQPVGRTRWVLEVKGRDNVWHTQGFHMEGEGSKQSGLGLGGWSDIQRDEFFPNCYRIAIGKGQGAYAGVDPEFSLVGADSNWNGVTEGSTSNFIRIIHMQVESRVGWGAPLVTAGATSKAIRAPDDLRVAGSWFKRVDWSLGLIFCRLSNQPAVQRVLHVRDAAPMKDDYGIFLDNGVVGSPNTTGGASHGTIPGLPAPVNSMQTVVMTVGPSRFALFQNGVATGEQSLIGKSPPNIPEAIRMGARLDGTNLQSCSLFLRLARYWTGSMSDAEGAHYAAVLTAQPLPPPVIPPVVSIQTPFRIREGGILTVPINKSGTGVCSVTYTTKEGTAKVGTDYNSVGPATMSFGADETVKTFTVQTIVDALDDHGKIFTVELSNFVGCTPGNTVSQVTITDPPKVHLPLTASVKEGNILTIDITKTGEGACSVFFETKQSKVGMVGIDYIGVGSPAPIGVPFEEFETKKPIAVTTLQDTISDPNETFSIHLLGETNCTVGNRICTVTITDDDTSTSGVYQRSVTFASPGAGAGIGKAVYRVTSLADTNTAGTLRYGINQGSRHIIFEVGGVIKLGSDLTFSKTDVYISGETAPYPGITLRGSATAGGTIKPQDSKRITFSHINFERCHDARVPTNTNTDVIELAPGSLKTAEDIEFRHCAFWWGLDETISVWATGEDALRGTCQRISFTDCLFAEPLYKPQDIGYQGHVSNSKLTTTPHNYGLIFGARSYNCDIQYSMFTDCDMRNPFIDGDTSIVLANNVQLNCNTGSHVSVNNYDQPTKKYLVTCVAQVAISGPDTTSSIYSAMRIHSNVVATHPAGSMVWADGLYSIKGPTSKITPGTTVTVSQSNQTAYVADITKVARPHDIPGNPVSKFTSTEIRQRAIDNIGPSPKNRIPHMTRKIDQLKGNTSARVHHQSEVGGPTDIAEVKRALNGTTKFPDGVTIPAYPTLAATITDAERKKVRDWLELFLARIQYD